MTAQAGAGLLALLMVLMGQGARAFGPVGAGAAHGLADRANAGLQWRSEGVRAVASHVMS